MFRTRRNLVFGFMAGMALAWSCAQSEEVVIWAKYVLYEDTAPKLGVKNVQEALDKLKGGTGCRRPWVHDSGITDFDLCRRDKDEMVKVGDFWVDRYEMALVDKDRWANGSCSGSGKLIEFGPSAIGFPRSGNWTTKMYACSIKGVKPTTEISWFQAAQACAASGKHLCTNAEWQVAAARTLTKNCNAYQKAKELTTTGKFASCQSAWGAQDMVGNASELVALWGQTGYGWMTKAPVSGAGENEYFLISKWLGAWPETRSANINGRVQVEGDVWTNGLPATARRGGDFTKDKGVTELSMEMHISPAYMSRSTGARCCMR